MIGFIVLLSEFCEKVTMASATDEMLKFVRKSMIDTKRNELKTAQGKRMIPYMMELDFMAQDLE